MPIVRTNEVNVVKTSKKPVATGTSKNIRQQEAHQKMIERVHEYHNKLDLIQHKGKGKVDLFVCSICFEIFAQPELLRNHFIKVS